MKIPRIGIWSVAPLLALCCIGYAQNTETKTKAPPIPQGLRRLAGMPSEHGGARLSIDNVQQGYGNFTSSVTMQLKVRGTMLTNSYTRTYSYLAGNTPTLNVTHQ
jgi:hypothetical protein